ncbi:SMP-30/gluconolactonase/LRE family protein [Rheinheimera texasensis]|uniref:SMP-30/gluconolactonase/LRE family protein n=1 Tax=Rheinheimera texasensis TaxID=306205 RepID=UPI0032B23FF2
MLKFKALSPVALLLTSQLVSAAPPTTTPVDAIAGVIAPGSQLTLIRDGFDGTEGPIRAQDGSLLFTETRANRIVRIDKDDRISSYLEQTNGANGLGYLPRGELVAVQVNDTQVGLVKPSFKTLSKDYQGKPFQRPNDLVISSKGDIYFTDSGPANQANSQTNSQANSQQKIAPRTAVYHLKPGQPAQQLVADNSIKRPNGIALSPDEKTLYIANSSGAELLTLALADNGLPLPDAKVQVFARLAGADVPAPAAQATTPNPAANPAPAGSGADGIAIDNEGRVLVATNAGIEVFSPQGAALGLIKLPHKPQNLAFAGFDKKTLYIVGRGAVYKIATLTPGYLGRAK